jgi:hypothetical protein
LCGGGPSGLKRQCDDAFQEMLRKLASYASENNRLMFGVGWRL